MGAAENIATSALYDSLLSAHLGELARARDERSIDLVDFDGLLSAEHPRFKFQAFSQAAKAAPAVDPKKDKLPDDTPVVRKPGWHPKKEYRAKLEAERAAKAAAESAVRRLPSPRRSRSRRARSLSLSNRRAQSRRRHSSPKREPMRKRRQRR